MCHEAYVRYRSDERVGGGGGGGGGEMDLSLLRLESISFVTAFVKTSFVADLSLNCIAVIQPDHHYVVGQITQRSPGNILSLTQGRYRSVYCVQLVKV